LEDLSGAFDEEGLSVGCTLKNVAVREQAFENAVLGPSRMKAPALTIGLAAYRIDCIAGGASVQ
jgi:hypothetical protein